MIDADNARQRYEIIMWNRYRNFASAVRECNIHLDSMENMYTIFEDCNQHVIVLDLTFSQRIRTPFSNINSALIPKQSSIFSHSSFNQKRI